MAQTLGDFLEVLDAAGDLHRVRGAVSPRLVITEVAYLLGTRLGVDPEVRFLGDLAAGNLIVEPVAASDWLRIAELVAQYNDLPLGTVKSGLSRARHRFAQRFTNLG